MNLEQQQENIKDNQFHRNPNYRQECKKHSTGVLPKTQQGHISNNCTYASQQPWATSTLKEESHFDTITFSPEQEK